MGTLGRILAHDGHLFAILTVPHRDAMPPPQLAADAPVPNVFQPVVIDFGEALRDDADTAIPDGLQPGFGQRLDRNEPLGGNHRLDDLAAALRAGNVERVRLFFDDQSRLAHILPQILANLEAILAGVRTAIGVDAGGLIHNGDHRQVMALADGEVVGIVSRRNFQGASAELTIHIFVGDDRDLAAQYGHHDHLVYEFLVARVCRVYGHRRIAQDGFRARRRYRDVFIRTAGKHVFEVIQGAGLLRIFHFQVRYGGLQAG